MYRKIFDVRSPPSQNPQLWGSLLSRALGEGKPHIDILYSLAAYGRIAGSSAAVKIYCSTEATPRPGFCRGQGGRAFNRNRGYDRSHEAEDTYKAHGVSSGDHTQVAWTRYTQRLWTSRG